MENLSKQQIILLSILVSFVTSICTGILTVFSLDEASPTVTQTINRVVERTVERVVAPTEAKPAAPGKTVVERETIVVKEDELVPSSVEKNGAAVVRVFRRGTEAGASEQLVSLGVIIRRDGLILAPRIDIGPAATAAALFADGTRLELSFATSTPDGSPFSLLLPVGSTAEYQTASVGRATSLRLGQTVIGLSGAAANSVSIGIVSALPAAVTQESTRVESVETDLSPEDLLPGSPLLDLSGDVAGFWLGGQSGSFVPAELPRAIYGF